jgi:hypothetical protein
MSNQYEVDINKALALLGTYLERKELQRELVVGGGAAITLLGHARVLGTRDIDIVGSKIDEELKNGAHFVAEELGLLPNWLNESATAFNDRYPEGWIKRIKLVFESENLIVHAVCREDMLYSKICSELDRGFDYDDIVTLFPTKDELSELREVSRTMKSNTGDTFPEFEIDILFDRLEGDLGHD